MAEEIRVLAEQSQEAVANIQSVTENVNRAVGNLANDSNRLLDFVDKDVVASFDIFEKMADDYNEDATKINELVSNFSATSEELLASLNSISEAIDGITLASNDSAAGTTNIAQKTVSIVNESAEVMKSAKAAEQSAEELRKNVNNFKIGELKQPIVQAIVDDITDAQSIVLVDYRGLTVAQDTELRKQLREAGIVYKVCKNTMMKRAFEGTDFAQLDEYLEGPSAIAISKDDATAPARIICKFAKTAQALEVKAGVVEGTVYDANGVAELSKVPSREELLSKLLGSLQSPITNLARVLNQIAEQNGAPAEAAAEE